MHHVCANRLCVAVMHLQPVSHHDNNAEMLLRTWYERRIVELESALAEVDPAHPLIAAEAVS